jgi:uncharacterized membrane protein YcaP (DUF421 family)
MPGEPVIVVTDGQPRADRMRREGVTRHELFAAMRQHGVADLADVRLAVLEIDGTISVSPHEGDAQPVRRRARGLKTT